MKKQVIAIDVDLVLVDVIPQWKQWLLSNSTQYDTGRYKKDLIISQVEYDTINYYTLKDGVDGFEFWRRYDLYDNASVYETAPDVIKKLYESGHDIVFVSYSLAGHLDSKVNFLKRSFPFIDKDDFHFISTKSKGFVKCDVLIDDRHSFLNQMENTALILFETVYKQDEDLKQPVTTVNTWKKLDRIFGWEGYY